MAIIGRAIIGGVLAAVALGSVASAQQGRFRAGVDLVNVGVMVLDKRGNLIADLTAADFEVFEEGARQQLRFFATGDADAEAQNLRLGLLFDTSGSMTDDIRMARTAAVKFLNTLHEAQDITLVDFDTEVRVARYGQNDFPRLVERIRERKPEGWTALYDALGIYLDGAFELDGRKVLVVYTDGGDTRSAVSFGDTLAMLQASDVTVYAIGFLQNQPHSARTGQRMRLQQIAEITGGEAYFPYSSRNLDEIYAKILEQVRAQYNLGFTSTNAAKDGTWRRIEVRLTDPDRRGLKVRSRQGYFAPLGSLARSGRDAEH